MDISSNEPIVVTGGAGFIGSRLANNLADNGHQVIVVDDLSFGDPTNLHIDDDNINLVRRSVLDDGVLPENVGMVYHLAAKSYLQANEENPAYGARVNVEGFINIVEQAIERDCFKHTYVSTSSLYGSHTNPVSEETDVEAETAYVASKLSQERYAEYYYKYYDEMEMVGLRPYSVYGGFKNGESHKGQYANIISQFAEKIANGESPVIFGDGSQTRDFIHVDDVVRALELSSDLQKGIYNIGTGNPVSFNSVVEKLNTEMGKNVEPEYAENPIKNYVENQNCDWSKFNENTGWEPEIDFEEGVTRVANQY